MPQDAITTYCPACGKAFRVPQDLLGKKILCKSCQTHFVVQADKPGIPAAAPPPPARPAAPAGAATTHAGAHAAPAATQKVPTARATNPPVTAATAAPVAVPPPATDELAPIPFDDSPVPISTDGTPGAAPTSVVRPATLEKVKIESKGPYFVIKLLTAGKMVHVNIEQVLNEHAANGWRLEQVLSVGGETYAILSRFDSTSHSPTPEANVDAEAE